VLKYITGKRRTRVMWVMALVWAGSWLILGAAGLLPGSVAAAVGVLAYMGVFAFGETLLQPTVPAVYNDLASDRNRGRYNAINSAAFQGGAITGPIAAGLLLDHDLDAWYIGVMVVGCLGIGVLASALERRLPAHANGVTAPETVGT
jgi:MFS family permease